MRHLPKYIYATLAVALLAMWVDNMVTCWRDAWAVPIWIEQFGGWLTYIIWPVTVALWTFAIGYIVGSWLLGRIGVVQDSDYLLSTAIGLGVVAFATYVLGHAQVLYWWVFAPAGVFIIYIGRHRLCTLLTLTKQGIAAVASWHWTEKVLLAVVLYYVWRTLWACFHPATGWDECNSHLVLPKLYIRDHGIHFHEWVNFANFPPFLEMLMTIQRMFTHTPGVFVPWLFHIGTLVVIWRLVKVMRPMGMKVSYDYERRAMYQTKQCQRCHADMVDKWDDLFAKVCPICKHVYKYEDPPLKRIPYELRDVAPNLIAILIYVCLPIVTLHSQAVLTDPVLVFYCGLLILVIANTKLIELRAWIIIVGLLCGIIISAKYTGIIWVGLTVLITSMVGKSWRTYVAQISGMWLLILTVALLYCSPWMLNNLILFGHPIFPTADFLIPESWGAIAPSVQAQLSVNYWSMLEYFRVDWTDWQELLMLRDPAPWILGRARPDELSPLLIVLMPLVVWQWRKFTTAGKWAVGIAVTYVAVWLLVIGMLHTRYMLPANPILAAACGVALVNVLSSKPFYHKPRNLLSYETMFGGQYDHKYRTIKTGRRGGRTMEFEREIKQEFPDPEVPDE
jgi:hypothetical protein